MPPPAAAAPPAASTRRRRCRRRLARLRHGAQRHQLGVTAAAPAAVAAPRALLLVVATGLGVGVSEAAENGVELFVRGRLGSSAHEEPWAARLAHPLAPVQERILRSLHASAFRACVAGLRAQEGGGADAAALAAVVSVPGAHTLSTLLAEAAAVAATFATATDK